MGTSDPDHITAISALPATPHIVVLTGAGISAESGIQTFRGAGGLWEDHRIEEVATPEAYERDPALVQRFYNHRRQQLLSGNTQPNPAHRALAELARAANGHCLVVTQNIDDLHDREEHRHLLHMHGELVRSRCTACGRMFEQHTDLSTSSQCLNCTEKGTLRPDIVWFGEMPKHMDEIYGSLTQCDLFIAIGTSGNVYPAAGFVQTALEAGAYTIEVNTDASQTSALFDTHLVGEAGEMVPVLTNYLLARY